MDLKYCIHICGLLWALPINWVNNLLETIKKMPTQSFLKIQLYCISKSHRISNVRVVSWKKPQLQDVILQRAVYPRGNFESWMDCRVHAKWVCRFYVSVSASVNFNHIGPFWPIAPPAQASSPLWVILLQVSSSDRLSRSTNPSSVRITCLYWPGNAGPTIHLDLWAQSLKTKHKNGKELKRLTVCRCASAMWENVSCLSSP